MIFITVCIILLAIAGYGGYNVKHRVRDFSRVAFDTDDIVEGLKKTNVENATMPKSVAAMTSLLLPQILKDFPEFDYDEWKVKSQNVLRAYIQAIETGNDSVMNESTLNVNSDLKQLVKQKINSLKIDNRKESFTDFRIHRTEISAYHKRDGRCVISFQSSVQSFHCVTDAVTGEMISGTKEIPYQTRYEIDLVYIQDRSKVENNDDKAMGLTCPNCGAAITNLGQKYCEYCGTGIVEFNIQAWYFGDIREKR